jgi:hypothetical protein
MLFALLLSVNVACDAGVLHGAWDLLGQAMMGVSDRERSAFVRRGADGNLTLSAWPYRAAAMEASAEAMPAGTIAIIHTHPNRRQNPSVDDADVARRLGIPVFVITRTTIRYTTGSRAQSVWHGDWNPNAPRAQTTCQ